MSLLALRVLGKNKKRRFVLFIHPYLVKDASSLSCMTRSNGWMQIELAETHRVKCKQEKQNLPGGVDFSENRPSSRMLATFSQLFRIMCIRVKNRCIYYAKSGQMTV